LPPIEEQKLINDWLNQATDSAVVAINKLVREISLLLEYRTRLIADVVTGKLDVRAVVTSLPEEVEEQEPIEEPDEMNASENEPDTVKELEV